MDKESMAGSVDALGAFIAKRMESFNYWTRRGSAKDVLYALGVILGAEKTLEAFGVPVERVKGKGGYYTAVKIGGKAFSVRDDA